MLWCNTMGVFYCIWGAIIYKTFTELSNEYKVWGNIIPLFGMIIVGWYINKGLRHLWNKIYGSITDPVWRR